MSDKLSKFVPKLLSFEHKCKETKCKQMSEEFENMKKFVLYSNQLNIHYLNLINDSENFTVDDKEVYRKEKENLFLKIKSEVQIIGETVRQIISSQNDTNLKTNHSKVICDLCEKMFPSNQMSTHLTEHLDRIFTRKPVVNNNHNSDENLNETKIGTQYLLTDKSEDLQKLLCSTIKEEPFLDDNSDDGSVRSDNFDAMETTSSDGETTESEESIEPPKRRTRQSHKSENKAIKVEELVENKSKKITKSPKTKPRSRKTQKTSISGNYVVICDECGKTCRSTRHLSHHLARIHKIFNERQLLKSTANNCHLCDFGNVSIEDLKEHFASEHNLTVNKWNFICVWPDCNQSFRFKTALDKHFRTHTGDLLYKCEWPGCTVQFNKQWKFKEHVRTHTGEKPFLCHWPGCDKAYGQRASYRSHVLGHNTEKHVCYFPECGKSFAFKHKLEQHILNIHKKGPAIEEKAFICSVESCGRAYATKQNLRLHMYIHRDRPRFYCSHERCDLSFLKEKSLQKHLEKPHDRPSSSLRTPSGKLKCDWPGCDFEGSLSCHIKIHKMRAHTGEKPEKCPHPGCSYAAVRKFELKVHMMKHTGETPFPCAFPNCGRRFKSQRALDTHMSKNHNS